MALVCHALYGAITHLANAGDKSQKVDFNLSHEISAQTMRYAVNIMKMGIAHKFALMPPAQTNPLAIPVQEEEGTPPSNVQQYTDLTAGVVGNRVTALLTYGMDVLDATRVAQRKLIPALTNPLPNLRNPSKAPNKYPVEAAQHYLQQLADAGLGTMIEKSSPTSGKGRSTRHKGAKVFKKHKYSDLQGQAKDIVNKLDISEDQWRYTLPLPLAPSASESSTNAEKEKHE